MELIKVKSAREHQGAWKADDAFLTNALIEFAGAGNRGRWYESRRRPTCR